MEVETRMKRNYMPSILPQRKLSRHAVKNQLPTVQEQSQGKFNTFLINKLNKIGYVRSCYFFIFS